MQNFMAGEGAEAIIQLVILPLVAIVQGSLHRRQIA